MKAISFLEYITIIDKDAIGCQDFVYEVMKYHKKVSQPFSFEKVVELFEGFEIVRQKLEKQNQDICFEVEDDELFVYSDFKSDDCELHNYVLCRTIDEFIVLCNNLNIELEWK